jgi:hypothetical protein
MKNANSTSMNTRQPPMIPAIAPMLSELLDFELALPPPLPELELVTGLNVVLFTVVPDLVTTL